MHYAKNRLELSRIFGMGMLVLVLFGGRSLENFAAIADALYFVGVTLVGLAVMGRLWCSIYISGYKDSRLIQEGPYSICRNPLYFCNMIGGVGLGLATETLLIPVLIIVAFAFYYPKVVREEEEELRSNFGAKYETYCRLTPRFFPIFSLYHAPEKYTVNTRILTRELFRSFWFVFGLGFLELLEGLQEIGILPIIMKLY